MKSKFTPTEFAQEYYLTHVVATVIMEEIPMEVILNWDQRRIKMVPSPGQTVDQQGVKWVEICGVNDKRYITAVFCGSSTGDFLSAQIIYRGKTNRCHPKFQFPPGWHITHDPKQLFTEQTMVQYAEEVIIPYVEAQ